MMRRDMNRWLDEHRLKVIACVLATGVAWGVMTAAVSGKADVSVVERMADDVAAIKTLVCRDYPLDSLCRHR